MPRVFIAVGSNLDPEENVVRGLQFLDAEVGIRRVSTFYRTPALDRPQDPPFANGVIEVGGEPGPFEMKALLQRVESRLGRKRTEDRFAPRTLDLDLLLHGDQVVSSDVLTLPHPDIRARPFVAIPLLELAPDLILPDSGMPLRSIVDSLPSYPMEPIRDLTRRLRAEVAHGS
jgi:dihydroneopterin aldolase/2-amino-4-hydroxy-6-hydroxymethyldihydropteridine diphosphokinase